MSESLFLNKSESDLPKISIWEGMYQRYGHCGRSSRWFNLLGNIEHADENAEWYCLVNGREKVSFSPYVNVPRLISEGDFNVEIDPEWFHEGINTLGLYCNDQKLVDVNVESVSGAVSDEYICDFTNIKKVSDVAQVVDGRWTCSSRGARCNPAGYDRLLALGDWHWKFYECHARFVIHQFSDVARTGSGPGVGFLLRWRGHYPDGQKPHHEWRPAGAICWYRYGSDRVDTVQDYRLSIMAGRKRETVYSELLAEDTSGYRLAIGVPYEMKACVLPGNEPSRALYKIKTWESGRPEPEKWDLEGVGLSGEAECGSALFVAHHADVTIQTCSIQRLETE